MLFLALALATVCLAGTACDHRELPPPAASLVVYDADGPVRLAGPARRVVSLFPSATDVLVALGARDRLVARTTYDTDSTLRALPALGGAVEPNLETILTLAPDVVIAWDGVNDEHLRQRLAASGIPTVSLQALDTAGIFRSITTLGQVIGRDSAAVVLNARLRAELDEIHRSVEHLPLRNVLYVAWNSPPMTAGPRTFTGQLIAIAGGRTLFPEVAQDWPTVSLEEVVRRQPDVLVIPTGDMRQVSTEELERLPGWRDLDAVRHRRIVRLPVELVNRPGPGVTDAARALRDALHPEYAQVAR